MNGRYELLRSIEVGDIVLIECYMVGQLVAGGPWRDKTVEGKEAIVLHVVKGEPWQMPGITLRVLGLPDDAPMCRNLYFDPLDTNILDVSLVRKGCGTASPGRDYPLLAYERKELRFERLKRRLLAIDWSYEGYCNAPTYLAALYLRNCAAFVDSLARLRRKDGTINPVKVQKAFRQHKLEIDPWAYEFPFDIPVEFQNYALDQYRPKVDWSEVARDFAAETQV